MKKILKIQKVRRMLLTLFPDLDELTEAELDEIIIEGGGGPIGFGCACQNYGGYFPEEYAVRLEDGTVLFND